MISKLSLLAGTPIKVGGYSIKPWTLGEINEFGEDNYNLFMSHFLTTKNSLKKNNIAESDSLDQFDDYEVFCALLISNPMTKDIVLEGLKITFGLDFYLHIYHGLYHEDNEGNRMLFDDSLFNEMQKVVSMQNYLSDNDEENQEFNPANKKAKELHEKLMKERKKVRENNQKDKDGLYLHDIISIVACYSTGVNLNTIWDYTIYKLYEEYIRIQLWDDFHNKHSLLPLMDEEERKNLKHWGIKVSPNIIKEEK